MTQAAHITSPTEMQTDDPILAEIARRLVAALHPQRVYLFGSRARGDNREDSDYDVLVLVATKGDRPYGLVHEAYTALIGVGSPVDVLVMTSERFERRQVVRPSLAATVGREGKLLYVA